MENVTHTPKYEVVFFDLYGTLIDIRTDEQCDAAWQALYDTACELGAQYDSVEALRERFEKLEAREMLHQSNHAIVRNGWDEFDVLPADKVIDLEPLITAALLLEFPLIPLCDEECKGLCPQCGANLNEGPCGCEPAADDDDDMPPNPFAALKDFPFDEPQN